MTHTMDSILYRALHEGRIASMEFGTTHIDKMYRATICASIIPITASDLVLWEVRCMAKQALDPNDYSTDMEYVFQQWSALLKCKFHIPIDQMQTFAHGYMAKYKADTKLASFSQHSEDELVLAYMCLSNQMDVTKPVIRILDENPDLDPKFCNEHNLDNYLKWTMTELSNEDTVSTPQRKDHE